MSADWISALAALAAAETSCVLVTVIEAKGSTPRGAGTKMIVTADRIFCTIGGGNLEFQAVEEARKLLSAATDTSRIKSYALGPALAQCCGGAVTLLLEPFLSPRKTLLLFGAGHVGREVVRVLENLPVKIKWIDERAAEFPTEIPANCEKIVTTRPLAKLKDVSTDTYILVMTHSHTLDFEIVLAALKDAKCGWLGMIGSDTKSVRFRKRLAAAKVSAAALEKFSCPIGLPGLNGKLPREIAIAVAAELLSRGMTCEPDAVPPRKE